MISIQKLKATLNKNRAFSDVLADSGGNNFNAIRLLMALGVLYNHSFKLFDDNGHHDITNYFFTYFDSGRLSVAVFFLISGMLLTQSFFNTKSRTKYILKRVLRIIPGLFICLCVTVFLIGSINSALPLKEYFTDRSTYRYFYNIFLNNEIFFYHLPGVFTGNRTPDIVNGSLWTLPFEITCYLFLFILLSVFVFLKSDNYNRYFKFFCISMLILVGAYMFNLNYLISRVIGLITGFRPDFREVNNPIFLFVFFGIGMLVYFFRIKIKASYLIFVLLIGLLGVSHLLRSDIFLISMEVFTISYGVILLSGSALLRSLNFKIDPSYGIYLYAWPIQQFVAHLTNLSAYTSLLITIPLVVCIGCCSYLFIEKPALKLTTIIEEKLRAKKGM